MKDVYVKVYTKSKDGFLVAKKDENDGKFYACIWCLSMFKDYFDEQLLELKGKIPNLDLPSIYNYSSSRIYIDKKRRSR